MIIINNREIMKREGQRLAAKVEQEREEERREYAESLK